MSVDVTKGVRQILVKSWLDLAKVRLQIAGATVIIRGTLKKARDDDDAVNGLFLEMLEQQIRNLKGVRLIRWDLDNWVHDRGEWRTRAEP